MGTTSDFSNIWLEVAGIIAPAPMADFLISYLHWVDDGKIGMCQAEAPLGWDRQDLCTVGYLVANKELLSAQELIDSLPPRPMEMLQSSTLMGANDNHLRKNPFRRRRNGKWMKRKQTEADAGISKQDPLMGRDGDKGQTQTGQPVARQDPLPGDDKSKDYVRKCAGDIDNIIGEDDTNASKGNGNKCGGDDGSKVEDLVDGRKGGDTKCKGKDDSGNTGDCGVARSTGDGHEIPQRRQKSHKPNPLVQVCGILIG